MEKSGIDRALAHGQSAAGDLAEIEAERRVEVQLRRIP